MLNCVWVAFVFCHITDLRNAFVACFCLAFTHRVTTIVNDVYERVIRKHGEVFLIL